LPLADSVNTQAVIDQDSHVMYTGGMKTCSEPGCDGAVVARGMCSRHYQRVRRGSTRDKPGPPPRYPEGQRAKDGGAPTLGVRLEPELFSWVRQQGGVPFVRRILLQLRQLSTEAAFARWWKRFEEPTDGGSAP